MKFMKLALDRQGLDMYIIIMLTGYAILLCLTLLY